MHLKFFLIPLLISSSNVSASPSCSHPVTFQITTTNVSEKCYNSTNGPPLGIIYNLEVIDGDTIKAKWTVPYPQLETIYLRIQGMDTPELFHPQCPEELILAKKAKAELANLVSQGIHFDIISWDKYGGRILIRLTTKSGQSIPDLLISKGLAIPYFGEKKTKDWCSQ